jgi:copper chaperone
MASNTTRNSRTYTVAGMSCEHCERAVGEAVSAVAGVQEVDVDLASGRLTVSGEGVADDAVRTAVSEAGYEVVS